MRFWKFSLAVLAVIIFVLPAAASKAQDTDNLIETNWQLTAITSGNNETSVVEDGRVTLQLSADNHVFGLSGCNSYEGSYIIDGDTISFGDFFITLRACGNSVVMEREETYRAALQSASHFEVSEDQLIIHNSDGQQLIFTPVSIPVNSAWQLISFGIAESDALVLEGTTITLNFGADGRVTGSGGCNMYSSSYVDESGTLTFSPIVSTKRACAQDGVMQQEQAYFAALQSATSYELASGNRLLFIKHGEGQQLVFYKINVLNNSQWQLVTIGGTPVIADSAITLEFGEENQVGGSGGCNTYGGSYTVEDDAITFSNIFSTLKACADSGIMEQELAFFAALNSATRYGLSGDQLFIEYGSGQQLVFTRIPPVTSSQ